MDYWKDASAYPSVLDEWASGRWAWEFLRRNPEYQADFAALAAIPRTTQTDEGPEESGAWRDESARLCDKWSIVWVFDPSEPDRTICMQNGTPALPVHVWDCNGLAAHELVIKFDLRFPVDRQIDYAKQMLQHEAGFRDRVHEARSKVATIEHAKGPHRRKLPEYLRALDAHLSGAKTDEIAATLYPKKKRELSRDSGIVSAETALKNALTIMRKGYLDLLRWP